MMKIKILILTICFVAFRIYATPYQIVNEGPIHEAYMCLENGATIISAVPNAPPPNITEATPEQIDSQAVWVPGYWAWSPLHEVFLWVTGVWRRPPPGTHWISGYWKNYPEGWVWIKGFWSDTDEAHLIYIAQPPPDPIDEQIPPVPTGALNYFWVPGYWNFDVEIKQYVWYSGRWDLIGAHWVYFPAHYIWREKGYVVNGGYWDWPLDHRGVAFAAIYIDPHYLDVLVYEPKDSLPYLFILEKFYPYWPNYSSLYRYHFYYHYEAWMAWGATPAWWNWPMWWCFTWQDTWWLWWWWTHPDYANPPWIDVQLAKQISPPPQFVVKLMEKIAPPPQVTANGVIGSHELWKALQKVSGKRWPILPSDPKQIIQIQEVADWTPPSTPYLSPSANKSSLEAPLKPFFGPQFSMLKNPPRRIVLKKRPAITQDIPQSSPQSPVPQFNRSVPKQDQKTNQAYLHNSSYAPISPRPFYQSPDQGYRFNYTYPKDSMQTLHQGHFMTRPQHQVNPAGPNVNPTPGDYSTLPGE